MVSVPLCPPPNVVPTWPFPRVWLTNYIGHDAFIATEKIVILLEIGHGVNEVYSVFSIFPLNHVVFLLVRQGVFVEPAISGKIKEKLLSFFTPRWRSLTNTWSIYDRTFMDFDIPKVRYF